MCINRNLVCVFVHLVVSPVQAEFLTWDSPGSGGFILVSGALPIVGVVVA